MRGTGGRFGAGCYLGDDRGDDLAVCPALRAAFGPAVGRNGRWRRPGMAHDRHLSDPCHRFRGIDRTAGDAALSAYGELYGRMQRKLFAEVRAGRPAASLKRAYVKDHEIPARMFNGVRVSLEGKLLSVREAMALRRDSLQRRIARAERQISDAGEEGRWQQIHQKRRRLGNLRGRLAALESDIAGDKVRLCFGSKRLWRKQHHLEVNGYASHEEWLRDWRDARSGECFVLGSRDETGGCQLCVAAIADDGSLTLRLRMPDCLSGSMANTW